MRAECPAQGRPHIHHSPPSSGKTNPPACLLFGERGGLEVGKLSCEFGRNLSKKFAVMKFQNVAVFCTKPKPAATWALDTPLALVNRDPAG